MNSINMLFPKWLCCQKRTFPLIFCGVLIAKIIKSQVLGKGKNFIQAAPRVFENTAKIHSPTFLISNILSKVKAPGKGEERKDFLREPKYLSHCILSFTNSSLHPSLLGTQLLWKSCFRRVHSCFTYYTPYGRFFLRRWNSTGIRTVELVAI